MMMMIIGVDKYTIICSRFQADNYCRSYVSVAFLEAMERLSHFKNVDRTNTERTAKMNIARNTLSQTVMSSTYPL
jgi:hypothetical protein